MPTKNLLLLSQRHLLKLLSKKTVKRQKMINAIHVLGKEIILGKEIHESNVTKEKLLSLVGDLAPEISQKLEKQEFKIRIESDVVIIYRIGAILG
jgi:hypothetical protein